MARLLRWTAKRSQIVQAAFLPRERTGVIRSEHIIKIFGDKSQEALRLLEQGLGKDEIRERTGHVVGVNDVSFELEPGEFFVIMGLSGSGKSTLLRCLNRLIEPTAGKVYLKTEQGELEVTGLSDRELREVRTRRMSMVFQRFALFPHRDVLGNVSYGLEIQGQPADERRERARKMLELVGLGGWEKAYPSELSGGMQQRVGLARALATDAQVLLMDEPFSALDPLIKVTMQNEMLSIQRELKRTVLFITHDLDEALKLGDRIAIMEAGCVVQLGTPEDIIVNPKTDYVANFVEHADATHVITAATVALPLPGERFEEVRREGKTTFYRRQGTPAILYGLDDDGDFVEMRADGAPVAVKPLREVLEEPVPEIRRRDVMLTATPDMTLRELMRGRTYTRLPTLVIGQNRTLHGVIDEREVVQGILERRGQEADRPPGQGTKEAPSADKVVRR